MNVVPGTLIAGRFEILAPLGAGGMGSVFRARDLRLEGVEVAVKVLRLSGDPQAIRRFHSEVLLARRVKHPGVCAMHEYGEDGELVYCVMELVNGRNLRELLRDAPLAWERAFEVALEAAAGLAAIHEAGILHRDVKSANLMVDARGRVRLVDFGIARSQRPAAGEADPAGPELTGRLEVVGSPEYMSPEQVRGRPLDARSDVYSFGVVLYELFTGRLPFRGDTPQAVLVQQLEQEPVLDGEVADALPPGVAAILRRALAKDPQRRWGSVVELAAALRQARALGTGTAVLPTPASAPALGSMAWLAIVGIALLALVAAGVALRERSRAQPLPVRAPASLSLTPSAGPAPSRGTAGEPSPSPSPGSAAVGSAHPVRVVRARPTPAAEPALLAGAAVSSGGESQRGMTAERSTPVVPPAAPAATSFAPSLPAEPAPPAFKRGDWISQGGPGVRPARCRADLPYCAQLEVLGIEGVVTLRVEVDDAGRVLKTEVVAFDDPLLRDCALRHLSRLRCEPGTRDGVPGRMQVTLPVAFSLK
jgi:TonB family protein